MTGGVREESAAGCFFNTATHSLPRKGCADISVRFNEADAAAGYQRSEVLEKSLLEAAATPASVMISVARKNASGGTGASPRIHSRSTAGVQ
jgi:hypothetical protein